MSDATGVEPVIPWDCYGWHARIDFVRDAVRRTAARMDGDGPLRVYDVGCGTGDLLTAPLARAVPDVAIVGLDTHADTIEHARARHGALPNLTFEVADIFDDLEPAGFVLCSEVLEHVPDYEPFFARLVSLTAPGGTLLVTVPNGYGPAEVQRKVWVALLEDTGLLDRLRRRRRRAIADPDRAASFVTDDSPHVNFFRSDDLEELCAREGLVMSPIAGRCFLAGPLVAPLMRGRWLAERNERLARRLPSRVVSSWMFTAERDRAVREDVVDVGG